MLWKKFFLLWLKQCITDLSLAGELQLEAKKTFENAFEHKVKLNEMFFSDANGIDSFRIGKMNAILMAWE